MKRGILCIGLILVLCSPIQAAEISQEEQILRDALPSQAQELLEPEAQSGDFGQGLRRIIENSLPRLETALGDAMKSAGIMLAALVLCAMAGGGEGLRPGVIAGVLVIATAGMLEVNSLAQSGREALQEMQTFSDLLLPAMSAATIATGGITAGTAIYAGTAFFTNVLMRLMSGLLLPMLGSYVALCAGKAVCGNELLHRVSDLVQWVFRSGLKTILFVFTGYLTLTGLISGSADATTLKAAKMAISGVVPVVGSMISDASETVLVGAATVKNAVGVFGMLAVLAICIGPFLRTALQYLLMKLVCAAGGALGPKPLLELMDAITQALGFLLGMTGTAALMLLIACVCYLKVVPV